MELCRVWGGSKAGAHRLLGIIQPRAHLLRTLLLEAQQTVEAASSECEVQLGCPVGQGATP